MGSENFVVGVAATNTVKIGAYGATEADAVSVGVTDGGVEFIPSGEEKEITCDQETFAIDSVTIKEGLSIKFNLLEASLANLALAMGQPVASVAGSVLSVGTRTDIRDYRTVYVNVKGPGPGTSKFTFYKVKLKVSGSHKYTKEGPAIVPVEMTILADMTRAAGDRVFNKTNVGEDTTAPTVALSAPADGGTVAKDTKGTVVWTITEAGAMDANSIVYGDTFQIINTTTPGSAALVAGTIAYDATAKTVTFTPTNNWTASDTFQAIVSKGLKDAAGNRLAAPKIEQFSVTA